MRALLSAMAALAVVFVAPPAHSLTLAKAADNIAYEPVHELGYTGRGVIIGVIDFHYVRQDHRTFWTANDNTTSRVTKFGLYGGSTAYDSHPTAAAGVAAGRGPGDGTYLGVAPGAEIWSASCSNQNPDIRQAYLDFSAPDAQGRKSQIFSMSLVADVPDCGLYSMSMFADWMAANRGALMALGTGNATDKIGVPGGNYNQITVGGLDATKLHPAAFGPGPTFDGRSKPDILAPATGQYLPNAAGANSFAYEPGSFDSFAIPYVAGAAALVREYGDAHGWTWDPRVAKAVLLNGATKLEGWTHADNQPFDYAQGAGRLNAEWTIYNYAAGDQDPGTVARRGWDIETLTNHAEKKYRIGTAARPGAVISAVLDWWRYTAAEGDNLIGSSWAVTKFENLDLALYRDADCSVVARSVSTLDSVEHVFFHVTDPGTYTLGVSLLGGGNRTETYGLAWDTLIPGDADGNGKIDGGDLMLWQQHYDPLGLVENVWTMGDWNWDGKVDGRDFALWQQNYDPLGTGLGLPLTTQDLFAMLDPTLPGGAAMYDSLSLDAVPEPATVSLLILGLASGAGVLRRRRNRPR